MSIELQIAACAFGSFFAFVLLMQVLPRMFHSYEDESGHRWRPVYGDKFGTGYRDQVIGYKCRRCGRWKRRF